MHLDGISSWAFGGAKEKELRRLDDIWVESGVNIFMSSPNRF